MYYRARVEDRHGDRWSLVAGRPADLLLLAEGQGVEVVSLKRVDGEPIVKTGPLSRVVPVGILERAAAACDNEADSIDEDADSNELHGVTSEAASLRDSANAVRGLARALYAAGRGESVDWSAV